MASCKDPRTVICTAALRCPLAAALLFPLAVGCSASRSHASLSIYPATRDRASYLETELHRSASFAADEHTVLASVEPLPRDALSRAVPLASIRAATRIVVAASTAKPVTGELLLLSRTSVMRYDVSSLTLIPIEGGIYELNVIARDGPKIVKLTVRGRPDHLDHTLTQLAERCAEAQAALRIPGRDGDVQ